MLKCLLGEVEVVNCTTIQCINEKSRIGRCIACVVFASSGSPIQNSVHTNSKPKQKTLRA